MLGWGFYSPGLECPLGYWSACSAVQGTTSNFRPQFVMEADETFVGCCPSGYKCANYKGQTCIAGIHSTTYPVESCKGGSRTGFGYTTLPHGNVKTLNVFAPMIQIAWKSSDRPDQTSTTATTATGSHPTSALTSPPESSPTSLLSSVTPAPNSNFNSNSNSNSNPSDTTPASPTGLPPATIAGIAVGVAAFVLLLIAANILFWRRQRRRLRELQHLDSDTHSTAPGDPSTSELATQGGPEPKGYYIGTTPAAEMMSESPFSELPTGQGQGQGQDAGAVGVSPSSRPGKSPVHEVEGLGHGRAEMPGQGQMMVCEMPTERYT